MIEQIQVGILNSERGVSWLNKFLEFVLLLIQFPLESFPLTLIIQKNKRRYIWNLYPNLQRASEKN